MQKHILIIDDEPISIRIMKNFIGDKYKVSAVTDGSAAMKFLSKYKPDVILLDYLMPIYDGAHLIEMIHKDKDAGSIPIIIVTSVTDPDKLDAMRGNGAKGIINKPVDKDELLNMIEETVAD